MVSDDDQNLRLVLFYRALKESLSQLAEEHGVNIHPYQSVLEEGGIHLALSASVKSSCDFFGGIWKTHAQALGLPDYLNPGLSVIDPETGTDWTILGLDPMCEKNPVRVMDAGLVHHWITLEQACRLQPL